MRVIIGGQIALDSRFVGACGAGADHGGGTASLSLPGHKGLHRGHESVVADNEQLAVFLNGGVFGYRLLIIDVTVLVHGLEFGVKHERPVAVVDDVAVVLADFVHAHHQVVVDAEHLGHGVVGIGEHHDVLASHVAVDVRLVKACLLRREEGIALIGLAIGVGHILGVDGAGEVAFRWGDLHVLVIGVFRSNHMHLHQGVVADDGGDDQHREVGFTGLGVFHGPRGVHNKGFTLRGGHRIGLEGTDLNVDSDIVF